MGAQNEHKKIIPSLQGERQDIQLIHCTALQWGAHHAPLTPPLSLHLPVGSLTAVIGTNGCGKSSLLRVVAGLQKPLAGHYCVADVHTSGIGYLVQQQQIDRQFPINVRELVSMGYWGQKLGFTVRANTLKRTLEAWHLTHLSQQSLLSLSSGELQRALLARLSLTKASLLLLDEPDAALDDEGKQLLWQHIHAWNQAGRTILVVSHDWEHVHAEVAEALYISRQGCTFGASADLIANLRQVA